MQILLATSNPHKLEEVRAVFDAVTDRITWKLLRDVEAELGHAIPEPVEDQDTFEGNALLKARYYAEASGMVCLADDSGIEADALQGAPGVHSARYSGVSCGRDVVDPANNRKLLEALHGMPVPRRTARYRCVLALVCPSLKEGARLPKGVASFCVAPSTKPITIAIAHGTLEGRIILPEEADDPAHPERGRGTHGFGYDPLFVLPPHSPHAGLTTAQITPAQKNALSHRGDASRKLAALMRDQGLI